MRVNRDVVKVVLAVTVLAVSAVVLWRYYTRGVEDDAPADQFIPFHCTKCGADFKYSHREIDKLWATHGFKQEPGRVVLFKCPKCGAFAAVRTETPDDAEPPAPPPR
jgi:predicted RNA-binding Zn-ribbon protein involved in translation (DUF1610 family)